MTMSRWFIDTRTKSHTRRIRGPNGSTLGLKF